jgi:hypothetical protein
MLRHYINRKIIMRAQHVTGKYSTPESVVMRFEAEAMFSSIVTPTCSLTCSAVTDLTNTTIHP